MIIKPCSGKTAFNSVPDKKMEFDLKKIGKKFEVITETPYLIVIKIEKTEVTIYPSGKLMIRTKQKETAEKISKKVYELINQ